MVSKISLYSRYKLCKVCGKACQGNMCRTCYSKKGSKNRKIISPVERQINAENRMKECIEEFKLKHAHVKYSNKELLMAISTKLDYILDEPGDNIKSKR